MPAQILSVSPAYGVSSGDVTLEILGTGFLVTSIVTLVSPTSPPTSYPTINLTFINSQTLRATAAAGSIPLGFYDVKVDNGGGDTNTLSQCYRSAEDLLDPFAGQITSTIITRIKGRLTVAPNGKPYDLREGTVVSDMITAPAPELAILWDRLGRVMKQGFAQYMGGTLLRMRGEEHGVIAKPLVFATGVVKTIAPVGTILPTNMKFSTTGVANSGVSPLTFSCIETASKLQKAVVTGTVTAATASTLTDTGKAWVVNEWAGGYVWITLGTGIGQLRKIISNTATQISVTAWDPGQQPDVTSTYQLFSGVDIQADVAGTTGNVAALAINQLTSPTSFVTAIVNPVPTTGGLSGETDAQFLARYLLTVRSPSSGGNVSDYQIWASQAPGVAIGQISVLPLWSGNGTVKLVIINNDNTIPNSAAVAAVQQYIDPGSLGQGGGKAPIGAQVTVVAATAVPIDFAAAITVAAGYNAALLRSQISTAIVAYLNNLPVGVSVTFTQLQYVILADLTQVGGERLGVADFDVQTSGHGVKKSSSGTWTQANVALLGTEKATAGTVTIT
jgi:uncharacterized phage protein gp47/JayE